jgi:hypothetical protein
MVKGFFSKKNKYFHKFKKMSTKTKMTTKINMKLLNIKNYAPGKNFLQYKVYISSISGVTDIFDYLKEKKICVKDEINKHTGRDSLLAMSMFNYPMMDLLFENGADPNNVLFLFATSVSIKAHHMISLLMKNGANFHNNFFGPYTGNTHVDIIERFRLANDKNGGFLFDGFYTEKDFLDFFNRVAGIETMKILCSTKDICRIGQQSACAKYFSKDSIRHLLKFIL